MFYNINSYIMFTLIPKISLTERGTTSNWREVS